MSIQIKKERKKQIRNHILENQVFLHKAWLGDSVFSIYNCLIAQNFQAKISMKTMAYAGKNSGVQGYGLPRRGEKSHQRNFENLQKGFLRKLQKMHYFRIPFKTI